MIKRIGVALAFFALLPIVGQQGSRTNGPGARVLLDAHNSYPESGKWADRIDRAIKTGTPLAIEQDLYWRHESSGEYRAIVAHDSDQLVGAPTFQKYFFERIQPLMERALRENRRESWPLVVLNLDLKTNQRELHRAILSLLEQHDVWLTTTTRTASPEIPSALNVGPLLVLGGQDSSQRVDFHDAIPVGQKLRVFGANPVPRAPGATGAERTRNLSHMTVEQLIPARISNYGRWVNFPWAVVEEGGQEAAGEFTAVDSTRLQSLVERAHSQGLWIRFYTLDGFSSKQDKGYTKSYNFGTLEAAVVRWRAVIRAGVDFVATDQYAEFAEELRKRH
ncbi:MAG: hypothetical protein ABJB66_01485 [Gemmatimonadaceae bacterium]